MPTREQPLQWGAQALWQQLEPLLPGLSVEVVRRAESTNSALLERARALPDAPRDSANVRVRRSVESAAFGRRAVDLQPCLLVAEHQSGGRGRQGRLWQSAPGASLTFSLGLPLALADWSGLSLAVGVALCEALDPAAPDAPGPHLGLKWPNDLWLMRSAAGAAAEGRKLGGILIETVAAGSQRLVVVGIGLNVLPFDTDGVNTGFASLRELDPAASAPQVLARLALPLVQALKEFEREGFAAFAARYAARDLLYGLPVRTTLAEVPDGIARGVSAQGALLVQSAAGIASVSSGEVSVRLAPPAAPAP
ncbi:MAG: biotin--[acetyl-CoA-carboxylase] ligase [Burkholderiales bacterium]|nr:biotin--[acetyl-CoA-carboxylase] ligase [Burkholderiales bacterium]